MVYHFFVAVCVCAFARRMTKCKSSLLFSFSSVTSLQESHCCPTGSSRTCFLVCVSVHSHTVDDNCVCVCVRFILSCSLLLLPARSVAWQCCSSETAAFWLLRDITCCGHCNNLIMPFQCLAAHTAPDPWDMGLMAGSKMRWRSCSLCVPWVSVVMDDPCERLWLQSRVALPHGWPCQHTLSPPSPCCD